MIAFIWRKGEDITIRGTGRAFNIPDDHTGELVWEYVQSENLLGRVAQFDERGIPLQLGDLGPVYICIGCQLVAFEWWPEVVNGRKQGHGSPTLIGTEGVPHGRLCTKCAESANKASWKK